MGDARLAAVASVDLPTSWLHDAGVELIVGERYEVTIGGRVVAEGVVTDYRSSRDLTHLNLTAPLG